MQDNVLPLREKDNLKSLAQKYVSGSTAGKKDMNPDATYKKMQLKNGNTI